MIFFSDYLEWFLTATLHEWTSTTCFVYQSMSSPTTIHWWLMDCCWTDHGWSGMQECYTPVTPTLAELVIITMGVGRTYPKFKRPGQMHLTLVNATQAWILVWVWMRLSNGSYMEGIEIVIIWLILNRFGSNTQRIILITFNIFDFSCKLLCHIFVELSWFLFCHQWWPSWKCINTWLAAKSGCNLPVSDSFDQV